MSKRSSLPKRRTIGVNNPLDKLDDDPLGFIPSAPAEPRASVPKPGAEGKALPALKQISIRVPPELYRRLKVSVARSGQSQQDYLTEIIDRHLDADGR